MENNRINQPWVKKIITLCFISVNWTVLMLMSLSATFLVTNGHALSSDQLPLSYLKQIDSQYTKVNGINIHYIHKGTGAPIILIHGGSTWLYSFRNNISELSKHFSVYALDMPGHGYTSLQNDDFTWDLDGMNRVIKGFMDNLGIESASLVGHSWGGGWSLYFAQQYPERIKKLVLIGSSGLDVPDIFEWELLKYPVLGWLLTKMFSERDVRHGLEMAFFKPSLVTDEMVHEVYSPLNTEMNRKAQYLLASRLDWALTEKAMPSTQIPTLILWGENDQYLGVDLAERFVKRLPNAKMKILKNCGHSLHEEYPEQTNQILIEFLKPMDN